MKKVCILFIFIILLICSSCTKKSSISIEEMYENINEYTHIEMQKYKGDVKFVLYDKNEMSQYYYDYVCTLTLLNNFTKCISISLGENFFEVPVVIETNDYSHDGKYLGEYRYYENKLILCRSAFYTLLNDYEVIDSIGFCKDKKFLVHANESVKLEIPSGVKEILWYACYDSDYLQEVVCNKELEIIDNYAFKDCYYLEKVILNNNLKKITYSAFENCVNLQYVVIPDSVEKIGSNAFTHGDIFLEGAIKEGFARDFASGEATVYYKGQWEYNSEGIPTPR